MVTAQRQVKYVYLDQQFNAEVVDRILPDIRKVALRGDFTLGAEVAQFEAEFAKATGARYAVGVRSGTDAIYLVLRALNIGPGDEVVTVPNTFPATVGAIIQAGARPVFVDVGGDQLMPSGETVPQFPISERIKAIIPVDWGGDVVPIAAPRLGLQNKGASYAVPFVIHDACQSVGASVKVRHKQGEPAVETGMGALGIAAAFSLHPLKNINVWGDGGVVTTNDAFVADRVRSLRNHGLMGRDVWLEPGINGRLETVQAVVGMHVLKDLPEIVRKRRENATHYDERLRTIPGVFVPGRSPDKSHAFHLYVIQAERRTELQHYLAERGVETKVHYPTPLHLSPALRFLGYGPGSFPNAEKQAQTILSLPIHQYLDPADIEYVCDQIRSFYRG